MSARTRHHLDLLNLGAPLRRYARGLTPDANAAGGLVHDALMTAFSQPPTEWVSARLEASLRQHMDEAAALAEPGAARNKAPS